MKYSYVITIALISILFSCREEPEVKINKELEEYFDNFESDADDLGLDVDLSDFDLTADIEDIPDGSGETAGKCVRYSNGSRHISIDKAMWNSSSPLIREFLVYHELGHCVLKREHEDGQDETGHCLSIMHSSEDVCIFNYTEMTRKAYLTELFK